MYPILKSGNSDMCPIRSLVTVLVALVATGMAQFQNNPWGQGLPTVQPSGMPGGQNGYASTSNGKAPKVYISIDLLPLERTMHNPKLIWTETHSTPVYCVSESPATNLVFTCPDCNSTEVNQQLIANTEDKTAIAGYPAARLGPVPINGSWHNKHLACLAFYNGLDGQANVTAVSLLDVQFLSRPVVVSDKFYPPVYGSRFFSTFPATLHCKAVGNPPPTAFAWYMEDTKISDGPMIGVNVAQRGKVIYCEVSSAIVRSPRMSGVVVVDEMIPPKLTSHNFREIKSSSVFEPNSNRLSLEHRDHRMQLLCQAKGYPPPHVFWFHKLADNKILNATCEEGIRISLEAPPPQQGEVTSSCSLVFDSYQKSGIYWCRACSQRALGDWVCTNNSPESDGIDVEVTGPPVMDEALLEELPNTHDARIRLSFCAEPPPDLMSGLYWNIDGQRLNIADRLGNFAAENPIRNVSYPSCYTAVLHINPLSDTDKRKTVELIVKNVISETKKAVNLAALAGNGQSSGYSEGDIGLAVGLSIAALVVIIALIVAFCWVRRIGCFKDSKIAKQQKAAPRQQKKYPINIIPEIARSTPQKERSAAGVVVSPPNDFYKPPEPVYPPPYGAPQAREGLNYAELDLVKDAAARRPVVSNLPVEYTRLQAPKPATSSIV